MIDLFRSRIFIIAILVVLLSSAAIAFPATQSGDVPASPGQSPPSVVDDGAQRRAAAGSAEQRSEVASIESEVSSPETVASRDDSLANIVAKDEPGTSTPVAKRSESELTNDTGFNLSEALSIIIAILLLVSLWINVFLLKWRRSVSAGEMSIVPNALLGIVNQQTRELIGLKNLQSSLAKTLDRKLSDFAGRVQRESGETRSSFGELLEAFTSLQKALTEKDAEIERLRSGYDAEIFRRFLNRFLKLERILGEEIDDLSDEDVKAAETLAELRMLLGDALAECGLEKISPCPGVSIRDAVGVETAKQKETDQADLVLTVAEVIEPGWRLKTSEGFDYVKEARVVVYVEAQKIEEVA